MSKHVPNFQLFEAKAYKRLLAGAKEYGDQSFSMDPLLLINEVEEELLDIVVWTFITLERLDGCRKAIARAKLEQYEDDLDERLGEESKKGG